MIRNQKKDNLNERQCSILYYMYSVKAINKKELKKYLNSYGRRNELLNSFKEDSANIILYNDKPATLGQIRDINKLYKRFAISSLERNNAINSYRYARELIRKNKPILSNKNKIDS